MTKYKRITGKVFGGNATATENNPQIAQFGSALAGTFLGTTDVEVIQNLPAWGQGWEGAVTPETQFPALPEMTGAMKVLSHQICGILQQGLSEWDNGTIYYTNNFSSKNGKIFISQTDENQGNDPETDTTNWKEFSSGGGGLEICDIGTALYVDESKGLRRYLNGQIVDINTNTQAFLNRLLQIRIANPDYFTDENTWQSEATLNIDGCVYKFVLNYADDGVTIISVRLPKYPDYVELNGGGVLPVVGNGKQLALNSSFGIGGMSWTYDADRQLNMSVEYGKTIPASSLTSQARTNNSSAVGIATASQLGSNLANSGIQTTLNQTKIKLRYFIQIATGQETENNIKNELELINPYSLFEPKYSDVSLYNASWVLSSEAYLSKTVYVTAYEALQVEYNTEIEAGTTVDLPSGTRYTKRGISVKLSTDSDISDYDFVINTENETFRTPLKSKLAGISRSGNLPVVGNGKTLGFTDGTSFAGSATGSSSDLIARGSAFGASSSGASYTSDTHLTNSKTCGIATASQLGDSLENSGLIASLENIDTTGLYLYFYVGDVAQNANIVDLGRISEELSNTLENLQNIGSTIVKTYIKGNSGYIIFDNGYCEQWGSLVASKTTMEVTFLKTFSSSVYNFTTATDSNSAFFSSANVSSIKLVTSIGTSIRWKASGFLAEGEY